MFFFNDLRMSRRISFSFILVLCWITIMDEVSLKFLPQVLALVVYYLSFFHLLHLLEE